VRARAIPGSCWLAWAWRGGFRAIGLADGFHPDVAEPQQVRAGANPPAGLAVSRSSQFSGLAHDCPEGRALACVAKGQSVPVVVTLLLYF
jgi:hypothetical protein